MKWIGLVVWKSDIPVKPTSRRHTKALITESDAVPLRVATYPVGSWLTVRYRTDWLFNFCKDQRGKELTNLADGASVMDLNRIRLTASPPVMEAAEASLESIVQNYFRENITLAHLNAQLRDGARKFPDPLANFSAACRIELWGVHRVR